MHRFVDIHCHLLPGLDDGADSVAESLAMARMAVADGIETIAVTPHQLGSSPVDAESIRQRADELKQHLGAANIPLQIYLGADVRIDPGLIHKLQNGSVLTLADQHKHVLLELPHEIFVPIDQLLKELHSKKMVGILSHPERNQGLLANRKPLYDIVEQGGLLQITAGSITGAFGNRVREFTESLLSEGLVHFVATDAHNTKSRPPIMSGAFQRICELTDEATALDLCVNNPGKVVKGCEVHAGKRVMHRKQWRKWLKSVGV
jgi:protein-tyrosine phosphatase